MRLVSEWRERGGWDEERTRRGTKEAGGGRKAGRGTNHLILLPSSIYIISDDENNEEEQIHPESLSRDSSKNRGPWMRGRQGAKATKVKPRGKGEIEDGV